MSQRTAIRKSKSDIKTTYSVEESKNSVRFYNSKLISSANYNSQRRTKKKLIANNQIHRIKSFILFLLILIAFSKIILCNKFNQINFRNSYIELTINGTGTNSILSDDFSSDRYPKSIYINGNLQAGDISVNYDFTEEINTVKLVWDEDINSCYNLFKGCSNIIEINLRNFVTTSVTDMDSMFSGCSALTSINLSNFITSNVRYMNNMFYDCSSLTSIDLTKFDTSNVIWMNSMFSGCSLLDSLDLSKFNTGMVTTMDSMFYNCQSLASLDLSKFNTSKVDNMNSMFCDCSSLISLDISKFDTSNVIFNVFRLFIIEFIRSI